MSSFNVNKYVSEVDWKEFQSPIRGRSEDVANAIIQLFDDDQEVVECALDYLYGATGDVVVDLSTVVAPALLVWISANPQSGLLEDALSIFYAFTVASMTDPIEFFRTPGNNGVDLSWISSLNGFLIENKQVFKGFLNHSDKGVAAFAVLILEQL